MQRKGQRYGELTVCGNGIAGCEHIFWMCICACGTIRVVEENRLLSGFVRMCTECSKKDVEKANLMATGTVSL